MICPQLLAYLWLGKKGGETNFNQIERIHKIRSSQSEKLRLDKVCCYHFGPVHTHYLVFSDRVCIDYTNLCHKRTSVNFSHSSQICFWYSPASQSLSGPHMIWKRVWEWWMSCHVVIVKQTICSKTRSYVKCALYHNA